MIAQRVTFFGDDDVTPLQVNGHDAIFTTTISDTFPYLKEITEGVEAEIDLIEGKSSIGQTNLEIVDAPLTPGDQTTGAVTFLLSDGFESRVAGRRVLVEQMGTDGAWRTLVNGCVGDHSLNPGATTFKFEVRDIRERERKTRLFTKALNACVFPRGVLGGYGIFNPESFGIGAVATLVPDIKPMTGTYHSDADYPTKRGSVTCSWGKGWINQAQMDMAWPVPQYDESGNFLGYAYSNVVVYWRPQGSSGAYTALEDMPYDPNQHRSTWFGRSTPMPQNLFSNGRPDNNISAVNSGPLEFLFITADGVGLPADGEEVEFYVMAGGPPTDAFPAYIQGRLGDILKNAYDGVYSDEDPMVLYNADAMAAFAAQTPWQQFRITEVADDMKAWVEENIYKPLGAAPALDADGLLAPIMYKLPDASVVPFEISDSNTKPDAQWKHTLDDTVNHVVFTYHREYLAPVPSDKSIIDSPVDRLQSREVIVDYLSVNAASIIGIKDLTYSPVTINALSASGDGFLYSGDASNEAGTRLAYARMHEAVDRFRYGAQHIVVHCMRSDASVAAAKVGDWAIIGLSWLPDYQTQKRGMSRLAQITRIKDIDAAWREFELVDAGYAAQPLAQPVIGVATVDANGVVTVPVTSVPNVPNSNPAYCVVEIAAGAVEPAVDSGDWHVVGRTNLNGQNVLSHSYPAGSSLWVRAQSQHTGMRPSAHTASQHLTVAATPRIVRLDVSVAQDDTGTVNIGWAANTQTLGCRVYYQVVDHGVAPSPTAFIDVAASDGTVDIPVHPKQYQDIVVEVVPYTGFVAGAVSGTAGVSSSATVQRIDEKPVMPTVKAEPSEAGDIGTLNITVIDTQERVTKVEMQAQVGNGSWSAWQQVTSLGVTLVDKQPSKIAYRVTGYSAIGVVETLAQDAITFAIGPRPIPPAISLSIDASGNVQAQVDGDSDTVQNYVLASTSGSPSDASVLATAPIQGRSILSDTLLTISTGQKVFVKAFSENANGQQSDAATYELVWLGVGATPQADPAFGTPVAGSDSIRFPFALDNETDFIMVYALEYLTDPGTVSSIEGIGWQPPGSPIKRQNGATDITIPITRSSSYLVVTFVSYDILSRKGQILTLKAQGNGTVTTPDTPGQPVFVSKTTTSVTIKVPFTNLAAGDQIRPYVDNAAQSVYTLVAADITNGYATITSSNLAPGSTHSFTYTAINGDGIESAKSPPLAETTTGAKIPQPVSHAPTGQMQTYFGQPIHYNITFTWSTGAGSPSGLTYDVYYKLSTDATYHLVGSFTTTSATWDAFTDEPAQFGGTYDMYVIARLPNTTWQDSDPSVVQAVTAPAVG